MPVRAALNLTARTLLRHYPLYSGNHRIAHCRLLRPLYDDSPTAVAKLTNGLKLEVFPRDYVGSIIYFFGDYDRKISWIAQRVLRKGDAMLDIGAHHGVISMFGAKAVGPTGVVHAFEPQPKLAETFRHSVALNALSHVHLHETALSDQDGTMTLHVPDDNSSGASLGEVKGSSTAFEVRVRNSASYLASLNCPPLRFVKLDVEGHEETVLRSAEPYLRSNRPSVITFESHHDGLPFWERGAVKVMRGLGYEFFYIPKAMLRMSVVSMKEGVEPPLQGYDFVAVAPDSARAEILRSLKAE